MSMVRIGLRLPSLLLGVLLIASALGKWLTGSSGAVLFLSSALGEDASLGLASTLVHLSSFLEWTLGAALLLGIHVRHALLGTAVILGGFGLVSLRGEAGDCGCFGRLFAIPPPAHAPLLAATTLLWMLALVSERERRRMLSSAVEVRTASPEEARA